MLKKLIQFCQSLTLGGVALVLALVLITGAVTAGAVFTFGVGAQSAQEGSPSQSTQLQAAAPHWQGKPPDGRPHPGSPETGWTGLVSPSDPFSAGPGMGAWITKAGLPTSRSEVGVAETGGKVYVIGGYANERVDQPLVEEYDPKTDTWRRRAPMPRGLNHIGVVGLDGKLYTVGGFLSQNHAAVPDVSVYNPAANRWKALAPLPQSLGSVAVTALNGKLHAVGGAASEMGGAGGGSSGFANRASVNTHLVYDPKVNAWSKLAPLPEPRDHLSLIALDGRLYALGGRIDEFQQNVATVYAYDPIADAWQLRSIMPTARSGSAAAVLKEKIFVFGGEFYGGVYNQTEMYDPVTNRWSILTPMPLGRHGTGAATVGEWIYVPAGGPLNGGAAQTNAHQAFTYP